MKHVVGFHAIEETIRSRRAGAVLCVSRRSKRIDGLVREARKAGVQVKRLTDAELSSLSGAADHRGAVLTVGADAGDSRTEASRIRSFSDFLQGDTPAHSLIVVLDGVTDPQNLGAVLRSCDQFGVDLVVVPERRAAHVNPTVTRASAGASAHVKTAVVPNVVRALKDLQKAGYWVHGADVDGEPVQKVSMSGAVCLVLGSEGRGMSRLVRETCDRLVRIPTSGAVDSLNVSVAAGILMYEVRRQQSMLT